MKQSISPLQIFAVCVLIKSKVVVLTLLLGAASFLYSQPVKAVQPNEALVTGDSINRIDVAVLCEGYVQSEISKCGDDVSSFLAGMMEIEPYKTYKNHYNFWEVPLVSNQSGAGRGTAKDTALGAYYNCNGLQRLICVNDYKARLEAANALPGYDFIMVIVNDTEYGGSGGAVAVFSVHSAAPQLAAHEFGHTHANLGDEYSDPYPGVPLSCYDPNVTCQTTRENIVWQIWIDETTPLPTPATSQYYNVIGAFEGANYHATGAYRPKYTCLMRALGKPYCEVCREAVALADYNIVDLIDSFSPESQNVEIKDANQTLFKVFPIDIGANGLQYQWNVAGKDVPNNSNELALDASSFPGKGDFVVSVAAKDDTGYIKNDPNALSQQFIFWNVKVTADAEMIEIEAEVVENMDGDMDAIEETLDTETPPFEVETEEVAVEDEVADFAETEIVSDETLEDEADTDAAFELAETQKRKSDGCAASAESSFVSLSILAAAALLARRKKFSNR